MARCGLGVLGRGRVGGLVNYAITFSEVPSLFGLNPPVVESGQSGMRGAMGQIVRSANGEPRVYWNTVCPTLVTSLTGGTAVDLDHPLGQAAALEWLKGQADEGFSHLHPSWKADFLGWTVLSLARGGGALQGLLLDWVSKDHLFEDGSTEEVESLRARCFGACAGGLVHPAGWLVEWQGIAAYSGPETGLVGKLQVDTHVRTHGIALVTGNGIDYPALPERRSR